MTTALPDAAFAERSSAMRNRLMDACLVCIGECGLSKTSIRDIAAQAGIARQTVYKHFANKNAILAATLQREGWQFASEVAQVISRIPALDEKFISGFIYVVEHFTSNPILAQVVAPGTTFLQDVGMKDFAFAEFGQIVYRDVFAQHPALARDAEAISELWIRNSLSFIAMPGAAKSHSELRRFVIERLLPGVGLDHVDNAHRQKVER